MPITYTPPSTTSAELRERRERLGVPRTTVAGLAGCAMSTLANYENGALPRKGTPTLARILEVLGQLEGEATN